MIRVTMTGDTFLGLGEEVLRELEPRALAAVNAGTDVVFENADEMLSRPAWTTAGPYESAEHPPAQRTGRLRRSLKKRPARLKNGVVFGGIGTNHPAGLPLEFGGTVGRGKRVRIRAHPWIRPAVEKSRAKVDAILEDF